MLYQFAPALATVLVCAFCIHLLMTIMACKRCTGPLLLLCSMI
jgi:hypothetical protein